MDKYIAVSWPDYQDFMEYPGFREECYYCADHNIYFIPESMFNEVAHNTYPKLIKTNLGTIECYKNYVVVSGYLYFDYNRNPKKGDELLIRNYTTDRWKIVNCTVNQEGFPILTDKDSVVIGITDELIGSRDPEIPF